MIKGSNERKESMEVSSSSQTLCSTNAMFRVHTAGGANGEESQIKREEGYEGPFILHHLYIPERNTALTNSNIYFQNTTKKLERGLKRGKGTALRNITLGDLK